MWRTLAAGTPRSHPSFASRCAGIPVGQTPGMREHKVVSADGTVLRAWWHGRSGCPVLGLGLIPQMWPSLLAPSARLQLHSWYHRGALGPGGPGTLDDHVADAIAVLDAAGVHRCVVAGWSVGVGVGAALAHQHPDRVAGVLMVSGVPGATPGMAHLPTTIRSPLVRALTLGLRRSGPLLGPLWDPVVDPALRRLPVSPAAVWPLRHSGLLRPTADPVDTAHALRCFLRQHWDWFLGLALIAAAGPAQDLRLLHCPITVLAGRHDLFIDLRQVKKRVAGVPQVRLRILPTSHFAPLEEPAVILEEVRALQHRAAAVEVAVRAVMGGPLTSGSQATT